jgi:hypothetical protein
LFLFILKKGYNMKNIFSSKVLSLTLLFSSVSFVQMNTVVAVELPANGGALVKPQALDPILAFFQTISQEQKAAIKSLIEVYYDDAVQALASDENTKSIAMQLRTDVPKIVDNVFTLVQKITPAQKSVILNAGKKVLNNETVDAAAVSGYLDPFISKMNPS